MRERERGRDRETERQRDGGCPFAHRLLQPSHKRWRLTSEGVQSLLGQHGGLQSQLTDAELTGERQVGQVAMTSADLLQGESAALEH